MPTLTNEQIDAIRTRLTSPGLDATELRGIALTLLAYGDEQYMEADYWRESYRLVRGLSNDEIGAIIAVRDASRCHPRPCQFPFKRCLCDDEEPGCDDECFGIHNSADGFRDCDGNPI